uniref:Uncharacterized protein n=1 Tax=Glossina brevipalpis TaxID=37001 RepID=A0A1A9WTI1_9MUSC
MNSERNLAQILHLVTTEKELRSKKIFEKNFFLGNGEWEIGGGIMYILLLTFLIVYVAICKTQFLYHHNQPSGIGGGPYFQSSSGAEQFAHPAVVDNSLRESQLPPELSKSHRFFNNPHTAAALAKDSWFTSKEMPVIDREAEKIPRDMQRTERLLKEKR